MSARPQTIPTSPARDRVTIFGQRLAIPKGPSEYEAELWYQPIGYRWANNLKPYNKAPEPRRFTEYFDAMAKGTGEVLARASAESTRR